MIEYINRELSWLEFNQRVLSEASQESLPMLERLKFLSIAASNLDEFTPKQQLAKIRSRALKMYKDFYRLYFEEITPQLAKENLIFSNYEVLKHQQKEELKQRFSETMLPLLSVLGYLPDEEAPVLPALNIIVAVALKNKEGVERVVFIPVPELLGRFVHLIDAESESVVCIEEVISDNIAVIFEDEEVTEISHFRITRNGDIAVQEEDALDLAGEMEEILIERKFSNVVRLEVPDTMPKSILSVICTVTNASAEHIYRMAGPLNLSDFMGLAFTPGYDDLRDEEWVAQPSPAFQDYESMFECIAEKDVLLYHPYESFEPVIRLRN